MKKESGTELSSSSAVKKDKKLNYGSEFMLSRPISSPAYKVQENMCPVTPPHPHPPPPCQETPPSCAATFRQHKKHVSGRNRFRPHPPPKLQLHTQDQNNNIHLHDTQNRARTVKNNLGQRNTKNMNDYALIYTGISNDRNIIDS